MKPRSVNFDLIARPYRALEFLTFGRMLEKTRLHYLPELAHSSNALVIGDGDGRFLARLLAASPHLQATAIDSSAEMLRLLKQRCETAAPGSQPRLRVIQTDALRFIPDETYDLIVTHFFLDCLSSSDLELLIRRLVPSLSPKALWLISEFRIPSGTLALPASFLIRGLYFAFRMLTGLPTTKLPDYGAALRHSRFTRTGVHYHCGGLLASEVWRKQDTLS